MKRVLILITSFLFALGGAAEEPLTLGYIGSLSGPAASYGTAVLEGAQLAVEELGQKEGRTVRLLVEDDRTEAKNTTTAFQKLTAVDHVPAIIGGTWWANSIVRPAAQKNVLLLSCETLFNKDAVQGRTYFILPGDLRDWVAVYERLVNDKKFKTAAILRFTSGFADTLSEELQALFSRGDRRFLKDLVFSHFDMHDAPQLVLQLKRIAPDVVYIDGQPAGLAEVLRRRDELKLHHIAVFAHSVAREVVQQRLVEPAMLTNVFYTDRQSFSPRFAAAFRAKFGRDPVLNSDLGYYAVKLAVLALQEQDPAAALRDKAYEVDGLRFSFDERNVFRGVKQNVWAVEGGRPVLVY